MSSLAELQRAFTRMCFDAEPAAEDLGLLHAEPERWLLYRSMVRSRLLEMARTGLPRSAEAIGARFEHDFSRYLAASPPLSRYIREIVHEFVSATLPEWEADEALASHVPDLVRFESTKWLVAALPYPDLSAREIDFGAPAVINPTLRVVVVHHRVDRAATPPPRLEAPEHLLVYRKKDDPRIFTWGLNETGGRLFEAWASGVSLTEGTRRVLSELGREPDVHFVDSMAGVLADLVEQSVVLGAA